MRGAGLLLALLALWPMNAARAADAAPKIIQHELIDQDGVRIAWWSAGVSRNGEPPIVFIHGGPGEGSQVFRATVMPLLARSAKVAAFDMRGAGLSEAPKDRGMYGAAAVLKDIDATLDAVGSKRALLVAHSAGTIWALQYAQLHPDRVAGLVLSGAVTDLPATLNRLCSRLEKERPEDFKRAAANPLPELRCNPFGAFATEEEKQAWFSANMFPKKSTHDLVKKLDDPLYHDETGAHSILKDQMQFRVAHPELLTMPVLFIDGAKDDQTDEVSQKELAAKVRSGRYLAYTDSGHFPFVDEPNRYARDVLRFLRELRTH